ncbi:MAG: phosphomannomutase [Gammaproteobacteria bacterium]|nr:phosphomannomutase [Gammaproteobacteria bacterium]
MSESGVGFGTSGARGLVSAMTDRVCYGYVSGFLAYLESLDLFRHGMQVAIGGDLRPSTPRILAAAVAAIADRGGEPLNCGSLPTPAVANYAIGGGIPSLVVTGSHIPDDRNGIKFYLPQGEILKHDEAQIRRQSVRLPARRFLADGRFSTPQELPPEDDAAYLAYRDRYLDCVPQEALRGMRVGLYEHSAVSRLVLAEILQALGCELVRLGRSEVFVPVDTEAVRDEDVALAQRWSGEQRLDALVSSDGDGDRPLIGDEQGNWLRGDLVGVLCAHYLGIRTLVTPVSSNTLVERCGWFERVERTRIGSPYVIEAMQAALGRGERSVAGYEANGGFLLADPIRLESAELAPLPTRDAVIVILAVLMLARRAGRPLSALVDTLPQRHTCSDRIRNFPAALSSTRIKALVSGDAARDIAAFEAQFVGVCGQVRSIDTTDGVRATFAGDEVIHLRPSGNAPELRCYTEADSPERAAQINREALAILATWRD